MVALSFGGFDFDPERFQLRRDGQPIAIEPQVFDVLAYLIAQRDRVVPKEDLEEIGEALTPDTSAVLLLLEDTETEDAVDSMSGYNANVVTLTVGSDLSGQIAQYTAGAVTDDEGNVVAGKTGVAADADGDVAAAADVAAGTMD